MAENRFQPSSSTSKPFVGLPREPIDGKTPSSARTGKSESNSISAICSSPPKRVPHGVYMRPVDAPKYKNARKCSFDAIEKTNFGESDTNFTAISEIGVEPPDPELKKLWDDIDQYVVDLVAEEPERVRRVRGGIFKIPNSVAHFGETSSVVETVGAQKGKIEGISQSCAVRKSSGDSQSQPGNQITRAPSGIFRKPTNHVVAYNNSTKLDSRELDSCRAENCVAHIESGCREMPNISARSEMRSRASDFEFKERDERAVGQSLSHLERASVFESGYHEMPAISTRSEMQSGASDFEFKAQDERAAGKSLKRHSEGNVSEWNGQILVHGDKTCQNTCNSESHEVPGMSTQVQKYKKLSYLEFLAKKQRNEGGRVVPRPVETAIDNAHNLGNSVGIQKPVAKSTVGSMKHGTPFEPQALGLLGASPQTGRPRNLGRLSLWDTLKHRSCRKTAINCTTSRKDEEEKEEEEEEEEKELNSLAGERSIRTCHSSTDGYRAECSTAKLVGKNVAHVSMVVGDQSFIKEKECLKHDTKYENFQLDQSSCASSENLPLMNLKKVTQRSQDNDEIGARNRVKDILLRFRALCEELSKEGVRRVDCEAANQIKRNRDIYIPPKVIGHVPGIKIGDEFLYRMEISIIGLHKPPQAGIDFLRHKTYDICTSIVASGCGGYANTTDNMDYLIYSGHGGTCSRGRKEPVDQELQQGNLALKNSSSIKNAVRVIRGNKEVGEGGKVRSIYIYDGLYQVQSFWQERAPYGKMVYKFKLVRMPGQCKLSKNQWVKLGIH